MSCLENHYLDRAVGFDSAKILKGTLVLWMKFSRGFEERLIPTVPCPQCGTPISSNGMFTDASLENTTDLDDMIHRKYNFADILAPLSFRYLARVEQIFVLSEFLNMAQESPEGSEQKQWKERYPWLKEDNLDRL